jgi:pimeloyl-ACP methyl ester carboxylesterase
MQAIRSGTICRILGVLDALGWATCDLVGHSRGAIISTLLASAFPERIRRLVLLDAVVPEAVAAEHFPIQLRTALQDKLRLQLRPRRIFPSVAAAVASRAARGLTASAASALVERNLCECPEGVQWMTDPRLHGASAVKLTQAHLQAVLSALTMPTLLLLGQDSLGQSPQLAAYARQHIPRLTVDSMEGGHHFHMEANVAKVAERLHAFLCAAQECEIT